MVIVREAPTYENLLHAWKALDEQGRCRVSEVSCGDDSRSLLMAEIGAPDRPIVSITACMHGDEPVTPWALLSAVRDGLLDPRYSYRLWPCVNPSGYAAGTRQNAEGEDINRSFGHHGTTPEARCLLSACRKQRCVLQIDMHEDPDPVADGFYCYEPVTQPGGYLGPAITGAITSGSYPLQEMRADFDLGYAYDTLEVERGHVLYDPVESAETVSGLLFNVYMFCRRTAERVTTFESPARFPWQDRMQMHRLALAGAIAAAAR